VDNDFNRNFEIASASVLASEDWAPGYYDAPTEFGKLLRLTGRLERQTLAHFKELAGNMDRFIHWGSYHTAVHAFDVDVIVDDVALTLQEAGFLQIVFDTVASMGAAGAQAAERTLPGIPLGLDSTSTLIQQLTTENLANMVGKKIDKATGQLIDNPKKGIAITDTTRDRIAQSIKTSVRLGEKQADAAERLRKTIANPARAALIAETEAVNAFGGGRRTYAVNSGATGHKWNRNTAGREDACSKNAAQGTIPISERFQSGHSSGAAHPRCKCNVSYTYKPL
jgi:hypothetical protein